MQSHLDQGLELALACDIRIAGEGAQFSEAFVRMGLIPGDGSCWQLPRLVGLQAALDLLLTGKQIDARKAQRIGFAAEVYPEHIFQEMVGDFAQNAPERPRAGSQRKANLVARLLDGTALGCELGTPLGCDDGPAVG